MGGCLIQCATSKANKMKTSSSLSEQVLSDRNTFSTRTLASRREQADAGLNQLTPAQAAEMALNNARYRDKLGFPFIICARLNNIEMIREAFSNRLDNQREKEVEIALGEISKIGRFRLADAIL